MKSDLDALMNSHNMDAVIVLGNAENNPPMYYLTGGGHVNHAVLIKKRDEPPVLYCNAMEREEAEKSGLKVIPLSTGAIEEFLKRTKEILKDCDLESGRVAMFGHVNAAVVISLVDKIRMVLPQLEIVGQVDMESIFRLAMETKDQAEVDRIREVGKITVAVVAMVREFLTDCDVDDDEVLMKEDGTKLTVGDIHSKIRLWITEMGAEFPSGFIFAIGHDAGVPHSVGTSTDLMKLGQTIVFDIYPAEGGGGYYYDFTRTWSLGYATPEAQKLYDEVKDVYDKVVENIDMNAEFKQYQKFVCDEFGANGHKTPLNTDGLFTDGYVHSLGHGLGLNIHERPGSRYEDVNTDRLKPGSTFTIEPGLYYPDKNMGFRIEDSFWMRPDGSVERLAEFPYDFVLPMKRWKKSA